MSADWKHKEFLGARATFSLKIRWGPWNPLENSKSLRRNDDEAVTPIARSRRFRGFIFNSKQKWPKTRDEWHSSSVGSGIAEIDFSEKKNPYDRKQLLICFYFSNFQNRCNFCAPVRGKSSGPPEKKENLFLQASLEFRPFISELRARNFNLNYRSEFLSYNNVWHGIGNLWCCI